MKIFMNNVIFFDIVSSAILLLLAFGSLNDLIQLSKINVLQLAHIAYILLNLAFVTIIPLDRLVSLIFMMRYQVHITAGRAVTFCVFLWTIFGVLISIISLDLKMSTRVSVLKYIIITIFVVFITVNVKILLFVRKLNTRVHVGNPQGNSQTVNVEHTPSPWKNLKVTFPHVLLYIMFIASEIVLAFQDTSSGEYIRGLACAIVKVINPVFIIYRFKECNLQFRILVSRCRGEELRSRISAERYAFYREDILPDFGNGPPGQSDDNVEQLELPQAGDGNNDNASTLSPSEIQVESTNLWIGFVFFHCFCMVLSLLNLWYRRFELRTVRSDLYLVTYLNMDNFSTQENDDVLTMEKNWKVREHTWASLWAYPCSYSGSWSDMRKDNFA